MTSSDCVYEEKILSILHCHPYVPKREIPTPLLENFLYIGGYNDAKDTDNLARLNITHVLNCAACSFNKEPYKDHPTVQNYLQFHAEDNEYYDMLSHFTQAKTFIDDARIKGGKVLCHCAMGINRSGVICAAYIMCEENKPLLQTIQLMKDKRGVVLVNRGFQKSLVKFARRKNLLDRIDNESTK